jgi:hypothetical protein
VSSSWLLGALFLLLGALFAPGSRILLRSAFFGSDNPACQAVISLPQYVDTKIHKRRSYIVMQRSYLKMMHLCILFCKNGVFVAPIHGYAIQNDHFNLEEHSEGSPPGLMSLSVRLSVHLSVRNPKHLDFSRRN